MKDRTILHFGTAVVVLLLTAVSQAGEQPRIQKVEPPNWWIGMPDPMLVLSGQDLLGAQLEVKTPGVTVVRTKIESTGHYLLAWLKIGSAARPGPVRLILHTSNAPAEVPFSLANRTPASAGFRGFDGNDVIYLIMPDRFADGDPSNDSPPQSPGTFDRSKERAYHGGDLRGIQQHLGYLHDLGITTLWINPIYDNDNHSPDSYHGYGAVDFYGVDEHLGTLEDYRQLVREAHKIGIKVLLDIVVNHCGMQHPWVDLPPEPDWLNGTRQNHSISDGAFQLIVDQHVPSSRWRHVVDGWFFNVLPDLNQNNPDMARYLIQNSLWWAEEGGLDGFRLDTFPYVERSFWSEFHKTVFQVYPKLDTVGEVFNSDPTLTSFFAGGKPRYDGIDSGVSTVFDFPFFFTLRDVLLRDKPAEQLEDVFRSDWLYPHPEMLVTFIGNHDTGRFMGEPGATKEKLKASFALLLTTRGVPQLYAGDEIGMPGGGDPDNRRDFPGGFPGDPRDAFTTAGRTPDEQEVFSYLQSLLRLRKDHVALRTGKQWFLGSSKNSLLYARVSGDDRLLMIFNNSDTREHFQLTLANTPLSSARELRPLSAEPASLTGSEVGADVSPRSVAIYEVR
ncbi:MAG: alpha-amylase family glycosyl hydrolase [Terriglobales bacterium]